MAWHNINKKHFLVARSKSTQKKYCFFLNVVGLDKEKVFFFRLILGSNQRDINNHYFVVINVINTQFKHEFSVILTI